MSVHDAASKGYSTAAATYVAGRPDYPAETGAWLRDVVGLGPGRAVLDLGSGTGKFLPHLRETGARLLALEPVAAMRDQLLRESDDVGIVDGTASEIDLPDGAVDAVVCAQSFHWFATTDATAEIRRVLSPGGVLGLIWNVRDERVPWVAALSAITDPHEAGAPRYRTAALPPEQQAEVAGKVRALIAATPELAGRANVAFPYETAMFAYRKSDDERGARADSA